MSASCVWFTPVLPTNVFCLKGGPLCQELVCAHSFADGSSGNHSMISRCKRQTFKIRFLGLRSNVLSLFSELLCSNLLSFLLHTMHNKRLYALACNSPLCRLACNLPVGTVHCLSLILVLAAHEADWRQELDAVSQTWVLPSKNARQIAQKHQKKRQTLARE